MKNRQRGAAPDDVLKEESICEAAEAEADTRVMTWRIAGEMKKKGIPKTQNTHHRQTVDRILEAKGNVAIERLETAHLVTCIAMSLWS